MDVRPAEFCVTHMWMSCGYCSTSDDEAESLLRMQQPLTIIIESGLHQRQASAPRLASSAAHEDQTALPGRERCQLCDWCPGARGALVLAVMIQEMLRSCWNQTCTRGTYLTEI
jgi:hypothetical protein